jgi:hypothetical protein
VASVIPKVKNFEIKKKTNLICGEQIKAYENWTQARRDAVNCFYLQAEIGTTPAMKQGKAEQLRLLNCVQRSRNTDFSCCNVTPLPVAAPCLLL